jgi:hypothetical protein
MRWLGGGRTAMAAHRRPWLRWSAASFLAHELTEKNRKKGEELWWRRGRRLGFALGLIW